MKGKLFDEPQGPAQRVWRLNGYYTSGNITCQACGTEHSYKDLNQDNGESYDYSIIDGVTIVDKCCGTEIDRRFEIYGQAFFIQTIADFMLDPLANTFSYVRRNLELAITAWHKASKKAPKEVGPFKKLLPRI